MRHIQTLVNSIALTAFCLPAAVLGQAKQPQPTPTPFGMAGQMTRQQQANFPPEFLNQLAEIKTAALADDYAYRELVHLTENIGPRPSGSAQAKAAVDYVAAELRQLGLEVQLEEVKVPHWVRGAEAAELIEYPGQPAEAKQRIVLTALGGSTATPPEGITADVVVVNNFDELKALGQDQVAGKIVLFNEIFDQQKAAAGLAFMAYGEAVRYRAAGARTAADRGAVASLVRSVGNADYRLPHTGFSIPAGIPAGAVTTEDADGHVSSETTRTATTSKLKKKHGKWVTESTNSSQSSATNPPPEP